MRTDEIRTIINESCCGIQDSISVMDIAKDKSKPKKALRLASNMISRHLYPLQQIASDLVSELDHMNRLVTESADMIQDEKLQAYLKGNDLFGYVVHLDLDEPTRFISPKIFDPICHHIENVIVPAIRSTGNESFSLAVFFRIEKQCITGYAFNPRVNHTRYPVYMSETNDDAYIGIYSSRPFPDIFEDWKDVNWEKSRIRIDGPIIPFTE